MRVTKGFVLSSLISTFALHCSCVPAPKQTRPSSAVTVNSGDTIGIEKPNNSSNNNKSPTPATDSLAAIHKDQNSCVSCHEKDRPEPAHYGKEDCVTCHSYPSFAKVNLFSHMPKPSSCETCHARPAGAGLSAYPNQGPPAGFDPNNANAPGSGHYVGKDCATCHATPAEGARAFAFSHSTPRTEFCLPCHFNDGRGEHNGDGDVTLRDFGNCYSCHRNFDRNADRNFDAIE